MMSRLFVITILLMGCAGPHPRATQQELLHHYPLLLPSSYGSTLTIEQFLEGWGKGQHFQLHSQLEIDAQQILLLGLTAFQTRAFVLRYDGKSVNFENFTDRSIPFPPVMIISDIQKILWPTLPNQDGWIIVDDAIARVRLVFFEGRLVTRIQYEGTSPLDGDVELEDLLYGYQFRIRTLNVWGG
jgi:Protein of unknown function (DUF3261)